MTRFEVSFRMVAMAAFAVIATGCSSWRYRGFLDCEQQAGTVGPIKTYRIDSVSFDAFRIDVASGDNRFTQWIANKVYVPFYDDLSTSDLRNEQTYVQDITAASDGFCTEGLDAIPVTVRLAPHKEISRGTWSSLFPLGLSFGIVPSEKSCDVPFDIQVSFEQSEAQSIAYATAANLRIDSRCSLTPFGSVRYSAISGNEACETVAGSFLFAERDDALRKAFVKTIANAVKSAIIRYENGELVPHAAAVYDKDEPVIEFQPMLLETEAPAAEPVKDDPEPVTPPGEDEFFS